MLLALQQNIVRKSLLIVNEPVESMKGIRFRNWVHVWVDCVWFAKVPDRPMMDIIQVMKMKREPQEGQEVKDEVSEAEARAACSAFLEGEIIDLEPFQACVVKEEAQEFAEELSESYGNCLEIGTSSAAGNI